MATDETALMAAWSAGTADGAAGGGSRTAAVCGLIAACSLVAACGSVRFVEERYERQAAERLQTHYDRNLADRWVPAAEIEIGQLELRASTQFSAELVAGRPAAILGSCDRDCGELNLQVEDEEGFVLQTDAPEDRAFPFIEFVPEQSGTYRVSVGMVRCSAEPCVFALQFLQRRDQNATPDR